MAGKDRLLKRTGKSLATGNVIKKSIETGRLVKDNEEVTLGIATETEAWKRPKEIAEKQASGFMRAAERSKQQLAKGTRSAVQRQAMKRNLQAFCLRTVADYRRGALHRSFSDIRKHYTVVCFDVFGNYLRTVHLPLADDERFEEADKDCEIDGSNKGEKSEKDTEMKIGLRVVMEKGNAL